MPRARTTFRCSACGRESAAFAGRCPDCQEWNTLEEVALAARPGPLSTRASSALEGRMVRLKDVPDDAGRRVSSDIPEFDRVLGGGLVPGSLVLVGGEPGIG